MSLSNDIAGVLMEMISERGEAEIRRNELAQTLGCVPSQINYVISSRFTPEQGYLIESHRGGGGYIKITRIHSASPSMIMHTVNSIGDSLDLFTARAFLMNLLSRGCIDNVNAKIMISAISDNALRAIPPQHRDTIRASVLKQMLLTCNGETTKGKDD